MSRKPRVRTHNKGRELNFLENAIYDFASQRLLCLVLAVYSFFVMGAPDEWWSKPLREMLFSLGATDSFLEYAVLVFLGFAICGGLIMRFYFGRESAKTNNKKKNIVKQTVVRDAKDGSISDIISRLPAHLRELISKH